MKAKTKAKSDASAEEKIKRAASKLFTQKGYAAVKTRDIAKEAGINLALLNYYFRSKEKLFMMVMMENMQQFFEVIGRLINDETTSVQSKIELLVNNYIDMLSRNPDLPLFVMSHMHNDPQRIQMRARFKESFFMQQLMEEMKKGKIAAINPVNFIINIVGLTIFPFIGRPMLMQAGGIDNQQFIALMEERRTLIPKWIDAILKVK